MTAKINWQQRSVSSVSLDELALLSNVPLGFAEEAERHKLIVADEGRLADGSLKYRLRLKSWLSKLYQLRVAGVSWEEIQDWTKRRWLPGHEHEQTWPYISYAPMQTIDATLIYLANGFHWGLSFSPSSRNAAY